MHDLVRPTEIDQKIALDWLGFSLRQGDVISPSVLKVIQQYEGHAYTLAPATVDPARLMKPSEGGITGQNAAREALADVLTTLTKHGAACVVVEDDTRRRRDPKPNVGGLPTAFFGEMVIHWAPVAPGAEDAIYALSRGSGGYPLNALVSSASEQELGLVDGADLNRDIGRLVTQSLVAVIVSAYDDETFMIWEPKRHE